MIRLVFSPHCYRGTLLICSIRCSVDPALLNTTPPVFASNFSAQTMERDLHIADMPKEELPDARERHTENALPTKTSAGDGLEQPGLANVGSFWRSHRILARGPC